MPHSDRLIGANKPRGAVGGGVRPYIQKSKSRYHHRYVACSQETKQNYNPLPQPKQMVRITTNMAHRLRLAVSDTDVMNLCVLQFHPTGEPKALCGLMTVRRCVATQFLYSTHFNVILNSTAVTSSSKLMSFPCLQTKLAVHPSVSSVTILHSSSRSQIKVA